MEISWNLILESLWAPWLLHILNQFFFVIKIHVVYFKMAPGFLISSYIIIYVMKKMKTPGKKEIFYTKY